MRKIIRKIILAAVFGVFLATPALAKKACVCGPANQQSFLSVPTSGFCARGSSTTIVSGTGPWNWNCVANSCDPTSCTALLTSLTLTFVPPEGNVASNAVSGTPLAQVFVTRSDGEAFTGTLGFGSPYGNAGGALVLSGNKLVVGSQDVLAADVGKTIFVTVIATQ